MHPDVERICEEPKNGAAVTQRAETATCHQVAYAITYLDFGVARLLQRTGYAASLSATASQLYLGIGAWLGPDGGGFDLFKSGVSFRRSLRRSWDTPFSLGCSALVFDQVQGEKRWGIFAPFVEFAVMYGVRHLMIGPSASLQYRWMQGAPDDLQITLGFSLSIVGRESHWALPAAPPQPD